MHSTWEWLVKAEKGEKLKCDDRFVLDTEAIDAGRSNGQPDIESKGKNRKASALAGCSLVIPASRQFKGTHLIQSRMPKRESQLSLLHHLQLRPFAQAEGTACSQPPLLALDLRI